MVKAISWLSSNENQNNTHDSNWIIETISEIIDINEPPQVKFTITFNLVNQW